MNKLQRTICTMVYSLFIMNSLLWMPSSHAREIITPLPIYIDYDRQKAHIGKVLFSDPILSKDGSVSCHSCHDLQSGGGDTRKVSIGIKGSKGHIQSPTVLNSRYNFKQFWNGRAETLFAQANSPIHDPEEMGMNVSEVEQRINTSAKYKTLFSSLHQGHISFNLIIECIVEFEKALVTPNSRFDRYLRGELTLTLPEYAGFQAFKELGCITCHNGINIGGNSFQKIGVIIPYHFSTNYPDLYSVTKKEYHKNVFKVPTLRNIALSAPYFHDGSALTLEDAIKAMGKHNLGHILRQKKIAEIKAFLESLTGETPAIIMD